MSVAGRPGLGRTPASAVPLASDRSVPLAGILRFMDHESDNFTAEMLLKQLGAATGDALYAACGLLGVEQLIRQGGWVMTTLRLLGGCYLVWMGLQMLTRRARERVSEDRRSRARAPLSQHFIRGLATDLANPKTVVFFASICAVTVNTATPRGVRVAMLFGIVLTSIAWRLVLSLAFSTPTIRLAYEKSGQAAERVFGAAMCLLGLRFVKQAVS